MFRSNLAFILILHCLTTEAAYLLVEVLPPIPYQENGGQQPLKVIDRSSNRKLFTINYF